jgi:hypothetical protein
MAKWSSQDLVDTQSAWLVGRFTLLRAHATQVAIAACAIVERLDVVGHVRQSVRFL